MKIKFFAIIIYMYINFIIFYSYIYIVDTLNLILRFNVIIIHK